MSRMTASRAIAALVDKGFVVVIELGSYEGKRKPSRYRLTMFPCDGRDATHDYIEDVKEWRRQRGRRKPPTTLPPTVKVTWDIPTSHLVDVIDDVKKRLGEAARIVPKWDYGGRIYSPPVGLWTSSSKPLFGLLKSGL